MKIKLQDRQLKAKIQEEVPMQKREKISKTEIEPLLTYMKNIEVQLQEACGPTVAVEMRMRLIGQFSQPIRDRIKEQDDLAKIF